MNLIWGLQVEISHIQFAMIFSSSLIMMRFLVEILNSFWRMSGLKFNTENNGLLGFNCVEEEVKGLAIEIGHGRENWPIRYWRENWPVRYLWVPLGER